jgi:hypothetical protein
MSNNQVRAFFAYPSGPAIGAETVRTAIERINRQVPRVNVVSWERTRVAGKVAIQTILEYLDNCHLFMADVSSINPNVMFELGYAVARAKRTWVILDTTRESAKKQYEQLELLTGIGYAPYENSDDILRAFPADSPFLDLDNNIFDKTIGGLQLSRTSRRLLSNLRARTKS